MFLFKKRQIKTTILQAAIWIIMAGSVWSSCSRSASESDTHNPGCQIFKHYHNWEEYNLRCS
jgi:hypothetical protein